MPLISRRSFLVGAAALASAPRWASAKSSDEVDIVIVGAGAAGIAAARRVAAAKRSFVVIEAADRIGGRCITDTRLFGVPLDLGAHWIHSPEINPLAKLAGATGLDVYEAPPGQRIRVGRRYAREGELEDCLSELVRANRSIDDAAQGKADISCAEALPADLGDWRSTIEFLLGPFSCAKNLSEVSAVDFAKSQERDTSAFCRQGFGTLLARLAEGLPIRLSTPATRIETWRRGRVRVETPNGTIVGRAVIVTASTGVLAANKINFDPNLPKRYVDAIDQLRPGSYDHVALAVTGAPFGPQADELIFEKSDSARTAAMLTNISGTQLSVVDIAGKFGRELAQYGEQEMVAFVLDWLADLYGSGVRRSVQRVYATRWNDVPYVLGAFSAAAPGGQSARKALMTPWRSRVWFAGEAVHETLWGTVGGAWQSGERAAEAAMRRLGLIATPGGATSSKPRRSRRRRTRRRPRRTRRTQPRIWWQRPHY